MKQYEAVIKIMEQEGGYATLGHLYQNALKVRGCEWKTKTPFASIRRIVQDERFFFKIRPGLWALLRWKEQLPKELRSISAVSKKAKEEQRAFDHSYYQGLLVQIGNMQNFGTYVPAQDRNRLFLGRKKLARLATCPKIYRFSYEEMIRRAKTVDVIWFNERKMPAALFEVEHTTDMTNAMIKFNELRDFRTEIYIVAQERYRRKFEDRRSLDTFRAVRKDVNFLSYERLSNDHSRVCALDSFGPGIRGLYASN